MNGFEAFQRFPMRFRAFQVVSEKLKFLVGFTGSQMSFKEVSVGFEDVSRGFRGLHRLSGVFLVALRGVSRLIREFQRGIYGVRFRWPFLKKL